MKVTKAPRCWLVAAVAAVLAACGGGADSTGQADAPSSSRSAPAAAAVGLWQPAEGATPASGSYVHLHSESGDDVGQGGIYTYTQGNASIVIRSSGAHVLVHASGSERWWGEFQVPGGAGPLKVGTYANLRAYDSASSAGGVRWSGEGGGCSAISSAWFVVDHVAYVEGKLKALDMRFEQRCEAGAALHGKIHWVAGETSEASGPIAAPPALWRPSTSATPASGNYVYLESDAGDRVGAGTHRAYTHANAALKVWAERGRLTVRVKGDASWGGYLQAMDGLTQLRPGYYAALARYLSHDPSNGGMLWSRDGSECESSSGWFVVDRASYVDGALRAIELRFEQRCDGAQGSLRGKIRWAAADEAGALP